MYRVILLKMSTSRTLLGFCSVVPDSCSRNCSITHGVGQMRTCSEKPPEVTVDQIVSMSLLTCYGGGRRIVSPKKWLTKRETIQAHPVAGPGVPSHPPRSIRESWKRRTLNKYVRRKVNNTRLESGDARFCLVFPEDGVRRTRARCARTTNPYGKREAAGIDGNPAMAFAPELAERGYVTIAPDEICFGERLNPLLGHYGDAIAFYEKHKEWSIAGKMIWDKSRAIDYLQTLDEVDPERIGAIGHSHGAYGSLLAAAFDSRIKAVISSCGFVPFRTDGNTFRWSHATALIPKLGFFLGGREMTLQTFQNIKLKEVDQTPFDWHHILSS